MYKFEMSQVLNEKFLTKLIDKFYNREVQFYEKMERYYRVKNDAISSRNMKAGKPNNKLCHGFARYITNIATSYFAGKAVEYVVDDPAFREQLKKYIEDQYNYDYEISKSASKKGVAYELLYVNKDSELKTKKCEAQDIIPIYGTKTDEFINGFVRLYDAKDIDGNKTCEYADVYDERDIYRFKRKSRGGTFELYDITQHFLSDVPIIVYWNNDEMMGDYESVITLIDAYDKGQSNTANDMDYFTDAYLVIKGAAGGFIDQDGNEINPEDAERNLRNARVMYLDEKGDARFLVKQTNDSGSENYKDRLFKDIFFISQVPPMTDESFAGDLSGIALKYKLIGLEQLAIMKENQFRRAKQKKLKIITDWINFKKSTSFEVARIKQKYVRNFIENITEIIENVTKLEGVVSRHTQLVMLPSEIVRDAKTELDRIKEEARENEGMYKELMEDE